MVRPEFFGSESLAECSYAARLAYIGLWCYAKDDGKMPFHPRSIKSFIFPLDDMMMEDFLRLLVELEEEKCIEFYVNSEEVYLKIPRFRFYQKISHPQESGIPDDSRNVPVMLRECSLNVPAKELTNELVNKARGGDADAPPAPFEFDPTSYLDGFRRSDDE